MGKSWVSRDAGSGETEHPAENLGITSELGMEAECAGTFL